MTFAVFILGFSSILTGVNFIATVHTMRAPGMNWRRLPLFIWGIYATSVIQVLATPVLAITLLLLIMERALGIGIFDPRSAATRCSSSTSSGSTRTRPSTS
jgi:cytochrome c oxidase subunit 1